jgi:hypothetical protein
MAAPAVTARGSRVPGGARLKNGFQIIVAFSQNPTVKLFETDVTPPGFEGGEPVNITTQYNVKWETMAARALRTMTQGTFNAGYDPAVIDQIDDLINNEGSITVHFPGRLVLELLRVPQDVHPGDPAAGHHATRACQFVVTNYDPVNNVEADPVYTAGP